MVFYVMEFAACPQNQFEEVFIGEGAEEEGDSPPPRY